MLKRKSQNLRSKKLAELLCLSERISLGKAFSAIATKTGRISLQSWTKNESRYTFRAQLEILFIKTKANSSSTTILTPTLRLSELATIMTDSKLRAATMEDVNAATLAAFRCLEDLKVLDGNDSKHDVLFEEIAETISRHFNYPDYSNYN